MVCAVSASRETETLPHPQRVRLHPPVGGNLDLDQRQYLVNAASRDLRRHRERSQMIAPGASGVEVV